MKKRFLSIALALCMLLSVLPMVPVAATAEMVYASNLVVPPDFSNGWTELTASHSGATLGSGYYYLADNVTISRTITISGSSENGKTILDLNGHVLRLNSDRLTCSVIEVKDNAYFVLQDSSPTTKHYFTKDTSNLYKLDEDTGTKGNIELTGGVITDGTGTQVLSETGDNSYYGGGVFVGESATFNMTGGNIVGCTVSNTSRFTSSGGGGVCVGESATFNMTGGNIVGCTVINTTTADGGGGVFVGKDAYFQMTGGNIEGCYTNGENSSGGGVFVGEGATFTMSGGSGDTSTQSAIVGCAATDGDGGGVHSEGTFTMSDNSTIKNCSAKTLGGGVHLIKVGTSSPVFTMKGGSIKNCTATNGGGVCINRNATMDAQGGSVYGSVCFEHNSSSKLINTSATGSTIIYTDTSGNAIVNKEDGKIVGKLVKFMKDSTLYAETIARVVENQDETYTSGSGKITLPTPTKDGSRFAGWYKDTSCTADSKWDFSKTDGKNDGSFNMTANVDGNFGEYTLYAGWHTLQHVPAKAATVTETGNTEYWHCKDCDNNFSDEDGKNAIDLKDTVISKLPPEIIDGKGQSLTEGEARELTFRSNAAYSDFIRVELDGKTVDKKNYTVKEGSTIVTLKVDYVATLSVGEHTLGIVSQSGTATTTFTVNAKVVDNNSPQTGDNSHIVLWFALLFVSGGALVGTTIYGKKKKYSAK